MKVNNPNIPVKPILIQNKEEYIKIAKRYGDKYVWFSGHKMDEYMPPQYPHYIYFDKKGFIQLGTQLS